MTDVSDTNIDDTDKNKELDIEFYLGLFEQEVRKNIDSTCKDLGKFGVELVNHATSIRQFVGYGTGKDPKLAYRTLIRVEIPYNDKTPTFILVRDKYLDETGLVDYHLLHPVTKYELKINDHLFDKDVQKEIAIFIGSLYDNVKW